VGIKHPAASSGVLEVRSWKLGVRIKCPKGLGIKPREIKFLKIGNISQKPKQGKVVHSKNTDKTIYILVDGLLLQKVAKLSCFRKVPLIIPLSVGSNNT